jgi:hypothetical protein
MQIRTHAQALRAITTGYNQTSKGQALVNAGAAWFQNNQLPAGSAAGITKVRSTRTNKKRSAARRSPAV